MTKDKLDFTAAKKWCEEIVKNPKAVSASINLAACYLKLLEENEELKKSLLSLTNEAQGFLSMADMRVHGITNMRVLHSKIVDARAVLERHKEKT